MTDRRFNEFIVIKWIFWFLKCLHKKHLKAHLNEETKSERFIAVTNLDNKKKRIEK